MENKFWLKCWEENLIHFHKSVTNEKLVKYCPHLNLKAGEGILVPLCGKSLDLLYLQQQSFQVLGVELSELALLSFAHENNLNFEKKLLTPQMTSHSTQNLEILQGDFFSLQHSFSTKMSKMSAIYDRAALVALPPDLRKNYVDKLFTLFPPPFGIRLLLLTYEYPKGFKDGPPFSLEENDIRELYARALEIKLIERNEKAPLIYESVYLINW